MRCMKRLVASQAKPTHNSKKSLSFLSFVILSYIICNVYAFVLQSTANKNTYIHTYTHCPIDGTCTWSAAGTVPGPRLDRLAHWYACWFRLGSVNLRSELVSL